MTMPDEQDYPTGSITGHRRTEARLLAVQAMYQFLLMDEVATPVLEEFTKQRVPEGKADGALFSDIFQNATAERERYYQLISAHLAEGWRLERLGLVEKALLLSACAELEVCVATPAKVVINEFINIAKAYFEDDEARFINAVLDRVGKAMRPEELK